MGDRSPKDKQKKNKQHEKEHAKDSQHKQENMLKNRRDQGTVGQNNSATDSNKHEQYKKVG